jgi:DNA polymerase-3 subunit alpha
MSDTPFIHLHVHSAYSLAEGAIKVKDLVKNCVKNNIPAIAVTDTNNLFGAMEFALEAQKAGIQPIIGAQVQVEDDGQLVLLAQHAAGYQNLCEIVTACHLASASTHGPAVSWEVLERYASGIIALAGGVRGVLSQAIIHHQTDQMITHGQRLRSIFGDRLYVQIARHGDTREQQTEPALLDWAYEHNVPIVATNEAYFLDPEMHEAHDALLCIAEGRYITETDRRRETPNHYLKSPEEMVELFADLPEAIENTALIARRCSFLLKTTKPLLPPFKAADGRDEIDELRLQARQGLAWRLENYVLAPGTDDATHAKITAEYQERLEYELDVIIKMKFPGYFLIVSDFIKWAKDHDIPVGPGRGSGVGSLVAWSLKITDLDPIPLDLLFERFLNPERVSMPDFDVDFCQDRRDEVIRYVQTRYGNDHVAQIITFGKLQARAVVRDVGRVLQMPYGQVDKIAKQIPQNPTNPVTLEQALEMDADLRAAIAADETSQKLIDIAVQLEGLYRHASTHAAGVVIGDRPLTQLVALYQDPRSTLPATQFNMKYVEQAGLVKYDFLGLKTLTVIKRAVDYIHQTTGTLIDVLKIPLDDSVVYDHLNKADTVGLFQIESAGMRDAMRKIKPARFEDIIALVAMYRPGPMDNIPVYGAIKDGKQEPNYLHEKLQPVLEETYGIMVYQEQVMQAAQVLCGYTLGGADLLRRAMGKKIKAEMDAQRSVFVDGAIKHSGLTHEYASEIFDLIAKFADYGFNKSHAAAYAFITYQTAWLKTHYPVQFMAALMSLDKGNTDKLAIFKQAVTRMGLTLLPPDINQSGSDFLVEECHPGEGRDPVTSELQPTPGRHNLAIRYSLAALKGVGEGAIDQIVAERAARGPFVSLADFLVRIDPKWVNRRQIEVLAAAGAFECLYPERAVLYAGADNMLAFAATKADERATGQTNLFGGETQAPRDSDILLPVAKWDLLEKLHFEFEAVGFYLSAHPLDPRRAQLEKMGVVSFGDIPRLLDTRPSTRVKLAGVVIKRQEKMSKSGKKFAFLTLSDSTGVYEATVFSETLARSRDIMVAGQTLLVTADAEMQDENLRLTIQDVRLLDDSLIRSVRAVTLELENDRGLAQLQKIMASEDKGLVQLKVDVPLATGERILMVLPGRYAYQPATRDALYQLDGLKMVHES